jgi:hypothetical protein
MLEQYISHINKLCRVADIKNWTDSNHFYDLTEDILRQVQKTDRLLLGLTDCKYLGKRVEMRVFNVLY